GYTGRAAATSLARPPRPDAFRRLFRFYRQRDASDLRGVVDFSRQARPGSPWAGCPRGYGALPEGTSCRPRCPWPACHLFTDLPLLLTFIYYHNV
uniref:Uncharacterized protein n=1 Tax=Accipiter nisus TaxID=211598 RepID=A0A8B9NLJ9_9AVES